MTAPAAARCVGILLAGGQARRFGGAPKGLATLDGRRIADRVLMALAEATDARAVVSNDVRAPTWFPGHRIVADLEPGMGPLAGLATALRAGEGHPVIVVAWDMPFVTGALLRSLRRRGEIAEASDVPVHGDVPEPLCAYYRPEALAVAERLLARGERRARAVYEALAEMGGAVTFGDRGLERFGDPATVFLSVDTPELLGSLGGVAPVLPDVP